MWDQHKQAAVEILAILLTNLTVLSSIIWDFIWASEANLMQNF